MIKYFIFFIISIAIVYYVGNKNNEPHQQCKMNLRIGNGLEVDYVDNRIMFVGGYDGDCFKRLFSIPIEGGVRKATYEYSIFSDHFMRASNYLYKYLVNTKQLFVKNYCYKYFSIDEYHQNGTVETITANTDTGNFVIDESTGMIIGIKDVEGTLRKYNVPITQLRFLSRIPDNQTELLYTSKNKELSFSRFKTKGNVLYLSYKNNIYRGSIACRNCTFEDDLIEIFKFTNTGVPTDSKVKIERLEVTNDNIYFKFDSNLYRIPSTGGSEEDVLEFIYRGVKDMRIYNNHLYFIKDNKIQRSSLNNLKNEPVILYDANETFKQCENICSEGFSGLHCDQCNLSKNNLTLVDGNLICIPNSYTVPYPTQVKIKDGKCYQTPFKQFED